MKTKNAFAFRDFDSARILQRPFFKDFHFEPDKSDAEILESLNTATEDSVDIWERKLYVIKATHERLTKFRHLINRHNETRLDKYNKSKSKSQDVKITELQRPAPMMDNGINLSNTVIKAHRINITAISLKESITS